MRSVLTTQFDAKENASSPPGTPHALKETPMRWQTWQHTLARIRPSRPFRSVRARYFRPALERLEDRLSPAVHDTLGTAIGVSFNASPHALVSGTLAGANDVVLYAVTLTQGDLLTAAINAQQQGSPLQATLRLFDGSGAALSPTANSNGGDPGFTFSVLATGTYYVGVSSYGDAAYDPNTTGSGSNGASTGLYSLSVSDLLARFVTATPLNGTGQVLPGTLTGNQPQDYSVTVPGNTYLIATAIPQASPSFEPRLALYDATGQLLIQSDQQAPGLASATVEQHLQPGAYYLEVSPAASTSPAAGTEAYQLTTALASSLPPFAPLPVGNKPYGLTVADLGNGQPDIVTANYEDNTVSVLLGNGDGAFQPARVFAVGSVPEQVAVADLGNGHPDIVTVNVGDNTASVLLGDGHGGFGTAHSYSVGLEPVAVAVADLGNGRPDIVTANEADSTVSVLLGNGDGTFNTATPFAVGSAPIAVKLADLGNGQLDIVTANLGDNSVSVLLGNGNGTFNTATPFAVGNTPMDVAVADLGNGHSDIISANASDQTVSVLLGDGTGAFNTATPFPVGNVPGSLAVADLGNGHLDLVTANPGANTVSVLLGDGAGAFGQAQSFAVGSQPGDVTVADLGNGHPDVLTANLAANTVSVLLGNGDGTFETAQAFGVGSGPFSVAVGNLGNGRSYIVTADFGANTVSVLLSNGDGTYQPAQSYAVGGGPYAVAVADLGNGRADIISTNYEDNTVSVLLGNSDGTFQPAHFYAVGGSPDGVAVADLGNGHPDIVTCDAGDNTVSVLLGNGDGTFQSAQFYDVSGSPFAAAVADLGNGHPDIVTANAADNTVSVLLGNGDGTFNPATSFGVGDEPISVAVADLGNGHADVVTANRTDNTVSVLLGYGDGNFMTAQPFAVGILPFSVAVADLGNGHPDIVTANKGGNTVSVLLGDGNGGFATAQPYAVGSAPFSVALADLGNGQLDILTANDGDNTVSVLLGNGDGTFQPEEALAVGNGRDAAAVADLGNGQADVVTTNFVANTVSVSLGNGDGTFQPGQSFGVGNGPASVAVADLNGDGRPDIVTANEADNTVSVLLGNGDGTFQTAQAFVVGDDPVAVAVADLGNGHADIVTANEADNTVSVLLGNGDGAFQPAVSYGVGSNPASVAVADLGNGHPDIVVANSGDNTVSVLLGNGAGAFPSAESFGVGSDPVAVAVADLGNGSPDIITANYASNTVSVLLGVGVGAFLPAQPFAVGSFPYAVGVKNLGNGSPDIITANYGDSTVSVLLGHGNGAFQPAQPFAVGSLPESVVAADVNNDSRPDIITANAGTSATTSVLLNLGNARFQPPPATIGIPSRDIPQLQDLTGDSIPDAVTLDQHTGQILFRQGTGDPGNPYAPLLVVNPGSPAADFTLVQTTGLPEIAALDSVAQEVFLYIWSSAAGQFQQIGSFATGRQAVRIASAALDGNGLGDVVVGNDLDNSVTIAMQQSPGTFDTFTRSVGAGPSSITFGDLNGDSLPDIVVSDQASGDVSILFNDPDHSFTTQERYRAGQGPFDVSSGPNGTSIVSQLQTVGVVAADFTGDGVDLIALNANSNSFSLLRAAGAGSLIDPQLTDACGVGPGAVQALAGNFTGDGRQDLAVLTTTANGDSQILVFPNNGGAFGDPIVSEAGKYATGFFYLPGTAGQPDRLVVGDDYGDFLTLTGDGAGHFAVDRSSLTGKPLAVGQTPTGQTFVVLTNPHTGQVQIFFQTPGVSSSGSSPFAAPVPLTTISSTSGLQAAPGAVQLADLTGMTRNGQPILDLIVADRLGNDVLVYFGKSDGSFFPMPSAFPVGFEPSAVAVGDFTGDGVLDLAVANQGSNDVSILDGHLSSGVWSATPGPRLSSGGVEPIAVVAGHFVHQNLLDLRVTNAGGQVVALPGIGVSQGTGFFRDNTPQIIDLHQTIVQAAFDPTNGAEFVVLRDNTLRNLNGAILASSVAAVSADNGFLAVGLTGGGIGVMTEDGLAVELQLGLFTDEPSALQVLQQSGVLDVYASYQTRDNPVFYSFAIPVLTDLQKTAAAAQAIGLDETNLTVVAVLLSGDLTEQVVVVAAEAVPGEEVFVVFLSPAAASRTDLGANHGNDGDPLEAPEVVVVATPVPGTPELELQAFRLGTDGALQRITLDQRVSDQIEDVLKALQQMLGPWDSWFKPMSQPPPMGPETRATPEVEPDLASLSEEATAEVIQQTAKTEVALPALLDGANPAEAALEDQAFMDMEWLPDANRAIAPPERDPPPPEWALALLPALALQFLASPEHLAFVQRLQQGGKPE
jgi:FG-GAP-like repeat/Bacterial pre-peptidase C-terminal domain